MSATADKPQTLWQLSRYLVRASFRGLVLRLLIGLALAFFAWLAHTYLLVVVNEGFNENRGWWVTHVLAMPGWRFFGASAAWGLATYLLTSLLWRFLFRGPIRTTRELFTTPRWVIDGFTRGGPIAAPCAVGGIALGVGLGTLLDHPLATVQLALGTALSIAMQGSGLLLIIAALGWADLQRWLGLAKRPAPIAWLVAAQVGFAAGLVRAASMPMQPTSGWLTASGLLLLTGLLAVLAIVFRRAPGAALALAVSALVLASGTALADDGGWVEAGGSFDRWIWSNGAWRAVAYGGGPSLGVLAGFWGGSLTGVDRDDELPTVEIDDLFGELIDEMIDGLEELEREREGAETPDVTGQPVDDGPEGHLGWTMDPLPEEAGPDGEGAAPEDGEAGGAEDGTEDGAEDGAEGEDPAEGEDEGEGEGEDQAEAEDGAEDGAEGEDPAEDEAEADPAESEPAEGGQTPPDDLPKPPADPELPKIPQPLVDLKDGLGNTVGNGLFREVWESVEGLGDTAVNVIDEYGEWLRNNTRVGEGGVVEIADEAARARKLDDFLAALRINEVATVLEGAATVLGAAFDAYDNMRQGDDWYYGIGKASGAGALMAQIGKIDPAVGLMEAANWLAFGGSKAADTISPTKVITGGFNAIVDTLVDLGTGASTVGDRALKGDYGPNLQHLGEAAGIAGEYWSDPEAVGQEVADFLAGEETWDDMYDQAHELWKPAAGASAAKEVALATGELVTDAAIKAGELTADAAAYLGDGTQRAINQVVEWFR